MAPSVSSSFSIPIKYTLATCVLYIIMQFGEDICINASVLPIFFSGFIFHVFIMFIHYRYMINERTILLSCWNKWNCLVVGLF